MKIISWNVNGLNSTLKKGLVDFIRSEDADIYCLQEIKVSKETVNKKIEEIDNYNIFWNEAERKGYSGVMTLTRKNPQDTIDGLQKDKFDKEGRLQTIEFNDFYLLNAYLPNAGRKLDRLDFKIEYNQELMSYMQDLREEKHVILTGDLNVAHKEIDLANPKSNVKTAGFTPQERESFSKLLDLGYTDTFREFEQDGGHYTFWSYRNNARERNIGWRLDYFVVNQEFLPQVKQSDIMTEIEGSDHCPIRLITK